MFVTNKHDGPNHNLYLFYSNSLLGTWQEHPLNPVKTDIRSSRPAGNFFIHDESLYRPSMDSSEKGQGQIRINKVTRLDITGFDEEEVTIVSPYSGSFLKDKIHTLASVGNITLVDGARERLIFSNRHLLPFGAKRIIKHVADLFS